MQSLSCESLFCYLRADFGLDSLPEHPLEEMDPQARVVNPVWREADNLTRWLRERSGQRQVRLRRGRLKAELEEELRREIEQLDHAFNGAERHRREGFAEGYPTRRGPLWNSPRRNSCKRSCWPLAAQTLARGPEMRTAPVSP